MTMEYRTVPTTCAYCGCGCGVLLEVLDGRLIGSLPLKTNPVNAGALCLKGWNVHEFVAHPDRLQRPLILQEGKLADADWDTALSLTVSRLKEIRDRSGPGAIAFLSSARCTNEENYLLQKLARAALGTNHVDHCARL